MRKLLKNRLVRAALIALALLILTPLVRMYVLGLSPRQLPMQRVETSEPARSVFPKDKIRS